MSIDYFETLSETVATAIDEDLKGTDITAELIDIAKSATAEVITRKRDVIAGRPGGDEVFRQMYQAVVLD